MMLATATARSIVALREALLEFQQLAARLAPWPTEAGLRRSGDPGPDSPVLVTGNYALTVRRLLRALDGIDAWVVVAPSAGINVWCAASGGHLTTHQVVTALRTCGLDEIVRVRRAVLPQLAATGVVSREVARRSGWKVRFGPVRATDIGRYLATGAKDEAMRRVEFSARDRIEMALAWAAPAIAVVAPILWLLRPDWIAGFCLECVALSLAVFLAYEHLGRHRRLLFIGGGAAMATAAAVAIDSTAASVAAAGAGAATIALGLTVDYAGSTPVEGGSHFAERTWTVVLDRDRCRGVYACVDVCPEACFAPPTTSSTPAGGIVEVPHPDRCIRCGACIVQCPMDALAFADEQGQRIEPDVIRRFKLNLLGHRRVEADG